MENILGSDFNDFDFDNSLADHAVETSFDSTQPTYTDPDSSFTPDPTQNPTEPKVNSFLDAVNSMDYKFNQQRLSGPIQTGGYDPRIKERLMSLREYTTTILILEWIMNALLMRIGISGMH